MLIKTAGDRFELSTHERFLRCRFVGEVLIDSWRTVEEWREKRTATTFFDTWSDEGTRKVRVGRWEITWDSWASVMAIAQIRTSHSDESSCVPTHLKATV